MKQSENTRSAGVLDYIKALPQYILPHFMLSKIMYRLTRVQNRLWRLLLINQVIKHYNVDMSVAENQNVNTYKHFNDFFTRKLKPEARPVVTSKNEIACPVDGTVSQAGDIVDGKIFQAKGRHYTLKQLLGHPQIDSSVFEGGKFATIYLSPRDYHRIHMPVDGNLKTMAHVPGRLFSVNPATTRAVPGLFARNERVVTLFDTQYGPMAMIPVGAIFVGSIETVWHGEVTPPTRPDIHVWQYPAVEQNNSIALKRGDEYGRFNMGSTVVVLFGPQSVEWDKHIVADASVKMGQLLAIAKT